MKLIFYELILKLFLIEESLDDKYFVYRFYVKKEKLLVNNGLPKLFDIRFVMSNQTYLLDNSLDYKYFSVFVPKSGISEILGK